eukprot:249145_1
MSQSKHDKKVTRVLQKVGLVSATKLTNSLQGSIWRAASKDGGDKFSVTKVTSQYLHEKSMSVVDNQAYAVNEDILLEQSILKFLTQNTNCPKSIVRFERFFKTNTDYYLVMEDGGTSLFDFIMKAHKLIAEKKIEASHWKEVSRIIINQMIDAIAFCHSKHVCHFDISLENFLICDIPIVVQRRGNSEKIEFNTKNIQVKLCDFGLAQMFTSANCMSKKFCGKQNYKSPEVLAQKKQFDAKANDIWCLGVSIFMIMTGLAPWHIANQSDEAFDFIFKQKKLPDLLTFWGVQEYMDDDMIDLIELVFAYEEYRVSLSEIKQHPFVTSSP